MHRLLVLALINSLFILAACNEDNNSVQTSDVPADQIAAIVNGTVISKDDVNHFKELKGNPQVADEQILDEMIATELLREEAIKAGIADKKNVRFQIKLQESEILARLLMREKFGAITFTDDELQAAYQKEIGNSESHEFKARHILLKTEDEAKAVIQALRNGGDFINLAKERSTGPSGPNGGDLGWFQASRMVPPFADAVKVMNKGDVSVSPVQTDFGFHVIQLEDTRDLPQPEFETMRDQLHQSLIREVINSYIKEVQDASKISKT